MTETRTRTRRIAASTAFLVLAAGASSRMGSPKALLKLRTRPLLEDHLTHATLLGIQTQVVVLGFNHETILQHLTPGTAFIAVNPAPHLGQFSSIQIGLQTLLAREAGRWSHLMLTPVDCPPPSFGILDRLLPTLAEHPEIDGIVPTHQGRHGHPILIQRTLAQRLMSLPKNSRLDQALRESTMLHLEVESDDILWNLNTPADVARWRKEKGLR